MQKISSYLYPNKINVLVDDPLYFVRWNVVYQSRIKIYTGVDNLLTIDVKNSDQKRVNLSGMQLEMSIMDVNGLGIATLPIQLTEKVGLATVNIPSYVLQDITPQFLTFSIYRINTDKSKTVLYSDARFGALGQMELVGSAVPTLSSPLHITRFNPITNTTYPYQETYYSDAVEITKPNFLYSEASEALAFEFETEFLQAEVTVEFTKDVVISAATNWETIETFTIPSNSSFSNRLYFYPTVTREYMWARIKYITHSNIGKFKKVVVNFRKVDHMTLDGGDNIINPQLAVNGGWSTTQ